MSHASLPGTIEYSGCNIELVRMACCLTLNIVHTLISAACSAGVFWAGKCTFSYHSALGFDTCGGLGRGKFAKGVGEGSTNSHPPLPQPSTGPVSTGNYNPRWWHQNSGSKITLEVTIS